MTDRQKLEKAAAAARKELRSLALNDEATAEQIAEATANLDNLEARAAVLPAEEDPTPGPLKAEDGEGREIRKLEKRANLGAALRDLVTGGRLTGAELEFAQALKVGAGELLPVRMLDDPTPREVRAVTTVPASGSGEHTTTAAILPEIFETPVSRFIGAMRPSVPVGTRAFPIIGTGATAEAPAKGTAVTESSMAITAATATGKRKTAAVRVAVEDIYTLPGLADGIKRNARANVADLLESELVDALFSTSADAAPTAASTTVSYSAWRKLLADAVEGKLAGTVRDVRALVNVESLAKLETVDASTSYALSAADFAREKAGGIRASVHAPDTSSNDAEVSLILGRHAGSIVQPVWSGATVTIEDKYSDAAKGEIVFTLLVIADTVIARSAAFKRESIQLA